MRAPDFGEVRGQDAAIDACAVAVARRVGVLLLGPPGTGKTMIARRVPGLLGPLDDHARTWVTAEYVGAGLIHPGAALDWSGVRPFRAPHHTISTAALVGSPGAADGATPTCRCKRLAPAHPFHGLPRGPVGRAGEVQLARFGVLFLDEVVEYSLTALQTLASALRAMGDSAPMIVAAANRCPCGWLGETLRDCTCTAGMRERYDARLERAIKALPIDVVASVAAISLADMRGATASQSTAALRERIAGGAP